MVIAYSYLRFSSKKQEEGDSVRRQTALRDRWLARHPEVALDGKLKFEDRGVSGYRGEHRRTGDLARFVSMVERGRVPAGSYLIVENLDRLTREDPLDAIPAVFDLIKLGVRVVQLEPWEAVYEPGMDKGKLRSMIDELLRGNTESERKGSLLDAAWGEKKRKAREGRTPHGRAVPAWLELADGAYRVKPDAGRAVHRVFRLCAQGLGFLRIIRRLNEEGVPPIGRGRRWTQAYVVKLLRNRAVLGEYQPMRGHRKRKPEGDPVPGYFPAVVSEAEFHAARRAVESRTGRSGRPRRKGAYPFPFSGLVWCATDDCKMHVRPCRGRPLLVSERAANMEPGSRWLSFPMEPFVKAVLSQLKELQAADLFHDPGAGRVAELEGRLAEADRRLRAATAKWEADPESPAWQAMVDKHDLEKRGIAAELAEASRQAANPLSASWAEAVELMGREEPDRLRQLLLETVEEVRLLVVPRGRDRLGLVDVAFRGGGEHRHYAIVYEPGVEPVVLTSTGPEWEGLGDPGRAAEIARDAWDRLEVLLGVTLMPARATFGVSL